MAVLDLRRVALIILWYQYVNRVKSRYSTEQKLGNHISFTFGHLVGKDDGTMSKK